MPIEGMVPNADGKLRAGAYVEAEVHVAAEPTLVLPVSALLTGDEPAVLVVGPTSTSSTSARAATTAWMGR